MTLMKKLLMSSLVLTRLGLLEPESFQLERVCEVIFQFFSLLFI